MVCRTFAAALIPTLVACTTFGPVAPQDFIVAHRPPNVWVTGPDGSVVVVERPSFLGDTLTGFVNNRYREIPPDKIQLVKAHRAAPGRTALLMVGSMVSVIAVAVLVSRSGPCTVSGSIGFDESQSC